MTENVYYHATLALNAPLILKENKKQGGINVFVNFGDKPFLLLTKKRLAAMLEENPPEGEQSLILWPRTDKEGLLGSGTQLAIYKPVGEIDREPNVLHAVGELVKLIVITVCYRFKTTRTKNKAIFVNRSKSPL